MTSPTPQREVISPSSMNRKRACVMCQTLVSWTYVTSFTKNALKREDWIKSLTNDDAEKSATLTATLEKGGRKYICMDHFEANQLDKNEDGSVEMTRTAIPCYYDPETFTKKIGTKHEHIDLVTIAETTTKSFRMSKSQQKNVWSMKTKRKRSTRTALQRVQNAMPALDRMDFELGSLEKGLAASDSDSEPSSSPVNLLETVSDQDVEAERPASTLDLLLSSIDQMISGLASASARR
ncbi:unnamed protein product [Caenorhabditis auriculariae]|uniref:THAP-type domain-containing protein n=1 Tax=Caenorhabditis auriculariae TaxID=2777116 RepID=A0A8S1H6E4_9PELO|nr:unnamed protein product [Caenorhabditis auriculariae]